MKTLKTFLLNMLTGASAFTALLMVAVGYSDLLPPEVCPLLACAGMLFPFFVVANLLFLFIWVFAKWRYCWIPVVGFVLAFIPIRTYLPIHFGSSSTDEGITLLSYNVCGYGGNFKYEAAVDTVASYLKRIDADIVCLQEDMGGNGGSGFDKLKTLYPYNDTVHVSKSLALINAVGIHSRYPIVRKERIPYESEANGSVAYYLLIDADTVLIINNHLESTHLSDLERQRYKEVLRGEMEHEEAEAELLQLFEKLGDCMVMRAPQAEAVHQYITAHSQYPTLVCGDFNDTPISYARHTIAQGLTDCFVSAGCGLGLSYNQKGFNLRIDHLMCSSHFEPLECYIDNKIDASDHYPLICRLKMAHNP